MNTNENDTDPRAQLRRKLVAVLLGEAGPEETAEVERALASDPELAAERARLEATIGLVEGLKGSDASEHLPPAAASRLADAAAERVAGQPSTGPRPLSGPQPVRRAWHSSPVLRMAASITLLVGAYAAWRSLGDSTQPLPSEEVASLERRGRGAATREKGRLAGELSDLEDKQSAPAGASRPEAVALQKEADASQPDATQLDAGGRALLADGSIAPGQELEEPAPAPARDTGKSAPQVLNESQSLVFLGEQLQLLDELAAQSGVADEEASVYRFESQLSTIQPTENEIRLGYVGAAVTSPDPSEGAIVAGVTAVPSTASGPASPGPAGSMKGERSRGASGHEAAGSDLYLGRRPEATAATRAADDFAVKVAQGAAIPEANDLPEDQLRLALAQLGYAGIDADEDSLEALRGLGYVGGEGRFDQARYYDEDLRRGRRQLTPEQRQALIDALIVSCRRRPQERPRDMFYRWWGDNSFEVARTDPLSTFSVDVDTASYTLARRYLADGLLPEKAQIRTEEFVNYFEGDVPPPSEETFRVAAELAPSLFSSSPDTWMMRVAIRGREVPREERRPLALTFVVDVSGSMKEQSRLELVKHAMRLLVGELDARDSLSIVAFTNDARLVLPMTSARHRGLIESAIHPLQPEGGTNVEAGLRMGYEAALAGLAPEANNRVVLLSDGVGNIGETDAAVLNQEVARHRDSGIYLNTVGVGMNNHNDAFLEQLADKGDGICNYVDDEREARRALVENFTGAFEPIARDAKIQVEFDPAQVERYRLLGYENRAIADKDFRNDAIDAGEVGSGHQVVALYEIVRTGRSDSEAPLATVRVRWKRPYRELTSNQLEEGPASELAHPVHAREAAGSYAATSAGYRRSVLVGQLAEFLRRSIHSRDDSFETLLGEARNLAPELGDPDFDEFTKMVERTVELISAEWGRYDVIARRLDALRMQHYLRAQLEDLKADLDRTRLEQIDRQIQDLEAEVRGLLNSQDGGRFK